MSDNDDSDEEMYSYASSKTVYKRSHSRLSSTAPPESEYRSVQKAYVSSDTDELSASEYLPVARWAVDYNNKNYIRSLCNKNIGLHRKLKGRPQKHKIQYDNNYFTRSKVNAPKGLHRKIPEIERKYVPDNDELADATGWEFDYGPEFDQLEQDVHYIPEGSVIRRGCYRWYGVKRNDSDCDVTLEEERENLLNEELEQELKYGQEFLQSDIPYLEEQKNRRYTKGGYRFYEVLRNTHDFKPEEEQASAIHDPEWRRKYHCNGVRYLDVDMCRCERDDLPEHIHHVKKGKPFRRTILNKVYELRKVDSSKDVKKLATRLSLVPGEGSKSVYEGIPDRFKYKIDKSPSIRSVFKKKTEKYRNTREGDEYEEYEKEDTEHSYMELRPEFAGRLHKMVEDRHSRRVSDKERVTEDRKRSEKFDEYTYRAKQENTLYKKEPDKSGHRILEKSKERRKEKIPQGRDYPLKNLVVETGRNKEKHYGREESRSQRLKSSSRDRRHSNQIYKQKEMNKVEGKMRDRDNIDMDLQHIRNRGKIVRDVNKFETELTPDKDQVLKKMPPHVEERVRNIRQKMGRKMELVDRKYKDQRGNEAFDNSSSDEMIDLMKHKGHPKDKGESYNSEYEKYITENGSEMWAKKNEKYAELHHKNHR